MNMTGKQFIIQTLLLLVSYAFLRATLFQTYFINLAHRLFHPFTLPYRKSTKVSSVHDEVQINLASVSLMPQRHR
jgi:hypothetical protein